MTTFHLVRHAAHGLLGRVLTGRMPGVPLSEEGRGQAERLAASFAGRPVVAVVSSPLERAQETAAAVAGRLGLPVLTHPAFDEIDFGGWTGRAFADLEGDPAWDAWNRFRSLSQCPGGETMLAAQARAVAGLLELGTVHPQGEIVVVGHQDVLKAVLCHVAGTPLDMLQRLSLDPAHRCVLVMFEGGIRVDGLNLPPEIVTS